MVIVFVLLLTIALSSSINSQKIVLDLSIVYSYTEIKVTRVVHWLPP